MDNDKVSDCDDCLIGVQCYSQFINTSAYMCRLLKECDNKRSKSFHKRPHRLVKYTDRGHARGHVHVCQLPKLPIPLRGGSEPPSNTWLFWSTRAHMTNGISIGSAVFAGFIPVTYRQTHAHRQTVQKRV